MQSVLTSDEVNLGTTAASIWVQAAGKTTIEYNIYLNDDGSIHELICPAQDHSFSVQTEFGNLACDSDFKLCKNTTSGETLPWPVSLQFWQSGLVVATEPQGDPSQTCGWSK